uniref:Putative Ca+2 channel toxin-like spider n=1 Tax=Superstitionia donensis TaxID=311983 RepID=A0A1V1WBV1_9SCOR
MKLLAIAFIGCLLLLLVNEARSEGGDSMIRVARQARRCIPKYRSCDHNKSGCCDNASCRCNLFGTNCKCQRKGIFQG